MPTLRRRRIVALASFVAATAVLYAGNQLLHLDAVCIPRCADDPSLYVWMFRWMQHAVATGQNPFVTTLVGSPEGTPLYWVTTVSTQALTAVPLTAALGARASYNIMVICGLSLAAWSVYLLCLEITGRDWPSLAGGGLFLLSSYMTFESVHMNLLFTAPVALSVRLVIRYMKGSVSARRLALLGGLLLLAEFFASTEVFASMALFSAIAVCLHVLTARSERWEQARMLISGIGAAYLLCFSIASPFLFRAFQANPKDVWVPLSQRSVDLPELVIPSEKTLLGTWAGPLRREAGIEQGYPLSGSQGYLSVPIVFLLVAAWRERSRYPAMLLPFIGTVLLLSLGPQIEVFRRIRIPGPYALLSGVPLLEHAFPKRFPLYAWIGIALILAIWLASREGADWKRSTLWLMIGAITLLPSTFYLAPPDRVPVNEFAPEFFRTAEHRWFMDDEDVVLALAKSRAQQLEWHLAADFEFRLAEGYLGPYTPWGIYTLRAGDRAPASASALAGLISLRGIDWVALPMGVSSPWRSLLLSVATEPPIALGGIDLYRVGARDEALVGAPPSPRAQAAFRRGVEASSQGLLTDAAAEFRRVLALRPTNRFAHNEMAKIYLAYGDERLAEVHLRAALVENPDYVAPMVELARLWASEGRTAAADSLYRRVFLLRPSALTSEERARVERLLSRAGAPVATP